jgi:hypothetical protein
VGISGPGTPVHGNCGAFSVLLFSRTIEADFTSDIKSPFGKPSRQVHSVYHLVCQCSKLWDLEYPCPRAVENCELKTGHMSTCRGDNGIVQASMNAYRDVSYCPYTGNTRSGMRSTPPFIDRQSGLRFLHRLQRTTCESRIHDIYKHSQHFTVS